VLTLMHSWAQGPQERVNQPSKFHLAEQGEPIAGIPQDEALKIFDRHVHELYALPGTVSVSFMAEGLVVETMKPEALPAAVEGLPVFAIPPIDPRAGMGIDEALSSPPLQAEPAPAPEPPQVVQEPPARPCAPGYTRDPVSGECLGKSSEPLPPGPELLPPPPGVIVLKPGKVREQADVCPEGFEEVEGYGGWRFCVDPHNPEKIPPLWSPPIAGIPYEKVLEIHSRHVEELGKLPGVESAGLGADGIHVYTSNPDIVPKEIEGVPVKIFPATGMPGTTLSHTYNTFVRPLHGAVTVTETTLAGSYGTLTGVTLADGKPWLIFPAHFLGTCDDPPPCTATLPLNQCQHYNTGTQPLLLQPVTGGLAGSIGYAQRWTPISSTFYSPDVAAAFMDSDIQDGNGSLAADRKVHDAGNGIAFLGTPIPELPPVGLTVRMRSSIGPPHELQLQVQQVNTVANNIVTVCRGGALSFFNSQIRYKVLGGYTTTGGDSGSPVFDLADRLAGMINACLLVFQPGVGYVCDPNFVYGTDIITTKNNLKFDRWYGTASVPDTTVTVFRPSTAQWFVDNGNGRFDGCGTDLRYSDQCFTYGQANTDRPVTGDWDGNNSITAGVYRTNTNPQQFLLSNTNPPQGVNITINTGPPSFGYQPVVGKWPGVNGKTKLGVFRPSTGEWYLENGDYVVNGCPPDYCFSTAGFTQVGDKPLAGDWNGDGIVTIGVFRPSNTTFYLSNVNMTVPGAVFGWNHILPTGPFDYQPVVGDWTGPSNLGTRTKIGVYRSSTGLWYLDNGNLQFPGCAQDWCPGPIGLSGDIPVALDKSTIRAN
jgi:hypothetical protein